MASAKEMAEVIGAIPYRMAFAGGWIDQPFVSKHNPSPPGSMVVAALEPFCRFMDRCGMGTSTRKAADRLWGGKLPDRNPADLVRELYEEENRGKAEPSGSQDMVGLIYPGINRLDYDHSREGGVFPAHIEACNDPRIAGWLEGVIYVVPVAQRPEDYTPLTVKNLEGEWISRLGQSGKQCYDAVIHRDLTALGESFNECMRCWEVILPYVLHHPNIAVDLKALLEHYQKRHAGAMYSGCGGGYLYVASEEPVPGSFQVKIRISGGGD